MNISVIIVIACIALYMGYMFYVRNNQSKQTKAVDNADFKAEFAKAEKYKAEALTEEYPFLIKDMEQDKIDAFTFANNKQTMTGALKEGLKDRLKGMATLGTVRFTTINTAKYLVLSNDSLHLFDTNTDGKIDTHMVFGPEKLEKSSLTEIEPEGMERAAASYRGKNVKVYSLKLQTDDKQIELTIYSCLIFTNAQDIPSDSHKAIEDIVIANDFLKRLGDKYPNMRVPLSID